jgi:hypothetical protein
VRLLILVRYNIVRYNRAPDGDDESRDDGDGRYLRGWSASSYDPTCGDELLAGSCLQWRWASERQ